MRLKRLRGILLDWAWEREERRVSALEAIAAEELYRADPEFSYELGYPRPFAGQMLFSSQLGMIGLAQQQQQGGGLLSNLGIGGLFGPLA